MGIRTLESLPNLSTLKIFGLRVPGTRGSTAVGEDKVQGTNTTLDGIY